MSERAREQPEAAAPLEAASDSITIVRLQQTAGNTAVSQLLNERSLGRRPLARDVPTATATAPATFTSSGIQKVYDDNKAASSLTQTTALHFLDRSRTGPWKQLKWDDVATGAAVRVYHPERINQSVLNLCGPAAALNADAASDPLDYVLEVCTIFEEGKAGGKKVNDTLLGNPPAAGLDPADWMVLSAMQDVNNLVYDYKGEASKDPKETEHGAGQPTGQVEDDLKKFSRCVKTTTYDCFYWGELDEAQKANDLLAKHGDDVAVVIFVHAEQINDPSKTNGPNHFVRLLKPMSITDVEVKLDVFTWGSNRSLKFTTAQFKKFVSSFIVGARKESIDL